MSTVIILLLLAMGAVAGYLFLQDRQRPARKNDSLPLTIENVRPGGLIHLSRVGTEMDDMDVEIVGRHTYEEEGFRWFELEGEAAGGKVWVEIENDDELEVSVSVRKMRLPELGLSEKALKAITDRDEGTIFFEGKAFEFEDNGEANFLRHGDPADKERLRYWDFETDDGKWFLSVEAWGKDEYQAYLSQALSSSQVEVYSLGNENHERV